MSRTSPLSFDDARRERGIVADGRRSICLLFLLPLLAAAPLLADAPAASPIDPAGGQFFENSIRPLLAEQCFTCHGPKKQKGDLRLDSRAGLMKGGESGPIVVPGHPDQSLMVKAIGYQDADLQMPPKKRLSQRQVEDLARWVQLGAPWPDTPGAAEAATTPAAGPSEAPAVPVITDADRAWWSFQPIRRPATPSVRHADRVTNPIDAFVLAKLEEKGLEPNPPADKRTLVRRAYFDLIGLPPTPEAVEAFVADPSPNAYESLLDQLLARPEYGERWARFWLDVVRYGQTNGYERDGEKPFAWRYRDYVIRAFNQDKPYDRFVAEQLAGDELDDVTDDSIIATGYYHLGVHDDEPDDARAAEYDGLDDVVRTTSTAFLGLTIGCARCHDHKFDPIPQADYYRLLSFFHNTRPFQSGRFGRDAASYRPLGDKAAVEKFWADQERRGRELSDQLTALKSAGKEASPEAKKLARQIEALKTEQAPAEYALCVSEFGPTPRKTNILIRGNASMPGAEVEPAFLSVLGGQKPEALRSSNPQSSGLRRALAQWLTSPRHPLTARVMANRIWQYHFGEGIVPTPDDFGKTGLPPTHPELLDYLAGQFIDSGWSVKKLQKLIMLSSTYRMSSRADNERASQIDSANDLLWRQNMRRLEAEAIRDSVLAVSGKLNPEAGGRGFFPKPSREVIAGGSRPGLGWDVSTAEECNRRSIYAFEKRSMLVPLLETFDFNNTVMPAGARSVTTVAPQALMLLNDDFLQGQAEAFAARVASEAGPDRLKEIDRAYALALGREPTDRERQISGAYIDRQTERFKALQSRMTFRPEVPSSLSADYLDKLHAEDFLSGPQAGWTYGRGLWGKGYEGILSLINPMTNGPYALDNEVRFADGTVEGKVMLADGADLAAVIIRGRASGQAHVGYDVVLDPRARTVCLQRHVNDVNDVRVLASAHADLSPGDWARFRIEAVGGRFRVWLNATGAEIADSSAPVLDATDPDPLTDAGSLGMRAWGAAVTFDNVSVKFGAQEARIADGPADAERPSRQAMRSLCLVLFNLNEFVYVD
jgi:mono/diheme cytochrome c family protein